MELGKVKKFGVGWCIHHEMVADNAKRESDQTPLGVIGLRDFFLKIIVLCMVTI